MKSPLIPRQAIYLASTVMEMAALVAGGLFLGAWLDKALGTEPGFLFGLACFGFAAGMFRLIRIIRLMESHDSTQKDSD